MNSRLSICVSALALSLPFGVAAQAQDAPDPALAPETVDSTDIIVTAERRQSTAQKTAIALDVVGGDELRRSGINDIAQLQTIAPGVTIGAFQSSTIVSVRGVSSRDTTEIGDPAVAINLDGIFLQRPAGMNAAFFDLDRIEVLRGPQGTLYGRNATGGVVNLITKRPTQEFGGYASLTYGNYNQLIGEAAINVPLSETLAMRASFISRHRDGFRDTSLPSTGNPATTIPGVGAAGNRANTRSDDESTSGARLQFLWTPTDRLKVLLSGTYIKQGGTGAMLAGFPTTRPEAPTKFSETKRFPLNEPGDNNIDRINLLAEVDYDLGPVTASYLFGYVGLDIDHLYDNDGVDTRSYMFRRGEYSDDMSHEFRLSSNSDGPFFWQGGVFYYKQDLDIASQNFLYPFGVPVILRNFLYNVDVESKAAFGQASYNITDELKVSAGIRYSEDKKQRTGGRFASVSLNPPAAQVATNTVPLTFIPETAASRSSDSNVSWHFGIDYQATPRNLVYAKVDKGYKSGGFTSINAYGPETLIAYEIGSKNRFFDNQLQLNLSAFLYDYTNQQVSQTLPPGTPNAGSTAVVNAGSSRLKGIEAQATWDIGESTKLDLSVNYLDAKFRNFAVAVGANNVSLRGNQLIQSPKWVIQGGLEHRFEFANGGVLTPRVQAQYRSESYLTFFNRANDRQAPYENIDANITYSAPNDKWSIQAFVRNLTNSVVLTAANTSFANGTLIYQFGAPRTYGVRLSANF